MNSTHSHSFTNISSSWRNYDQAHQLQQTLTLTLLTNPAHSHRNFDYFLPLPQTFLTNKLSGSSYQNLKYDGPVQDNAFIDDESSKCIMQHCVSSLYNLTLMYAAFLEP